MTSEQMLWERSGPARGEWEEEHEREQAGMEYKQSIVIPVCEYATVKPVA